jgi:hypothetical protein
MNAVYSFWRPSGLGLQVDKMFFLYEADQTNFLVEIALCWSSFYGKLIYS